MQEIDKEIETTYGLIIKNITPFRDAQIINTSKGKKLFKKTSLSPERVLFIHGAKEHLYYHGLTNIDRYVCTTEGCPFVDIDGHLYTVSDMMEGRECNFDDMNDVINAATLLALLHKVSRGYVPSDNTISRDELGKLPAYFGKRLEEIKRLRNAAKKEGSRFDYLYLQNFDYFFGMGEDAIGKLGKSKYEVLVDTVRREGSFCHHDYTYHNVICGDNKISVINFDFCCFELKVYDIANFMRRKMRKCNWNIEIAKIILDKYRMMEDISSDEFEVLKIILQFPQKFWRVANKYYNSKRSWSEKSYLSKFKEVIDEVEYHDKFIQKFDTLY